MSLPLNVCGYCNTTVTGYKTESETVLLPDSFEETYATMIFSCSCVVMGAILDFDDNRVEVLDPLTDEMVLTYVWASDEAFKEMRGNAE